MLWSVRSLIHHLRFKVHISFAYEVISVYSGRCYAPEVPRGHIQDRGEKILVRLEHIAKKLDLGWKLKDNAGLGENPTLSILTSSSLSISFLLVYGRVLKRLVTKT